MENFDREKHWEHIYQNKQLNEVSWYQPIPDTSLAFIDKAGLSLKAKIIDIGGGDSFLVDHLLLRGYTDITVLDISTSAINRAKQRLGSQAKDVKWIVADAAKFEATEFYDFWHDRAAFHFLTDAKEISGYLKTAYKSLKQDGVLVIGTFSEQGPKKCSGIDIQQYSIHSMAERLNGFFEKMECVHVAHQTPFRTIQDFVFCSFKKAQNAAV